MTLLLNIFDETIIHFINQFSHKSYRFDESIVFLSNCQMLKGGVLMTALWWIWFKQKESIHNNQEHVISTLLGSFVAMFFARILANKLPYRARPILNTNNHLTSAYTFNKELFDNLSSFPSDHATLFFCLSIGLLYSSKKVGIAAISYTTLFIAFPRIYLGVHYPTDILGGAAIGLIMAILANTQFVQEKISRKILDASTYKHHIFYPLFFLLSYQIADMFVSSRNIITFILRVLKH